MWEVAEVRWSILFVLALLVISRVVAHIPLPGVDIAAMKNFIGNNQLLGFIDLFSGGGISNFSIAAMGVAPYITASIIVQLLSMVIPSWEELAKEGEQGQNKLNQYTRLLTLPISIMQSIALLSLLSSAPGNILGSLSPFQYIASVISMTAGSLFLVWLGDQISEKKIGNGMSLLIFAGIVATLPGAIRNAALAYDSTQFLGWILFAAISLLTIVVVIYMTEGMRNIPVSYARMNAQGRVGGGASAYLPIKVNQAGVIPIIFAVSIILFPPVIAQLFLSAKSPSLVSVAEFVIYLFNNSWFHGIAYFLMVIAFTYFYTSIIFQPEKVAENLQKQAGFIPGVRPGAPTAEYLNFVSTRIMLAGALFLALIAVLPVIVQGATGISALALGGTSLLIAVSVVLDTVRQIDSQLTMREYDNV
ncbi:MAG: preprotein translocase subunit SecY [Parcubacteria group bacterium Gr01-1014_18]|nr:MAG: preprotein translocase subunit SecY [Parcubacteria group bacterium Greene0416_36]TSC80270.1 MAG: preprotein translocase subunit SecY [Parcubacteria group bacterium Gr01-1014_18]TSC98249.1 MAG: preprotein translocase subunit SecY [Parcubacteria group bacterium Greene1014_20]TSD07008.1 MAG: preprotein translocase subunit SecY [Parcubacteria group bacterium Greene0714_2]